jgi:hypothetical protein
MTELSIEKHFLQEAERCRGEAARATNEANRATWLRMADDWRRLARGTAPGKLSVRGTEASL